MITKLYRTLRLATACSIALLSTQASATLIFSEVDVTSNSVSFTVNGNMTGYAEPSRRGQLSIQYLGDLWAGLSGYSVNSWSNSVFDTHAIDHSGNTGTWGSNTPYSWSSYNASLFNAIANNRRVTLWMDRDYLNPLAADGALRIVWGNGHSISTQRTLYTEYYGAALTRHQASGLSHDVTAVPEPATIALLGLGLAGIGMARRKRR